MWFLSTPEELKKNCLLFAVHALSTRSKRVKYGEMLKQQLLDIQHNASDTSEHNCDVLKSCIVSAAEKAVGGGKRKQPDWFEEHMEMLTPLIKAKIDAHLTLLHFSTSANRKEFRRHQRVVKPVVDKAKVDWICRVAMEGEAAVKDGQTRWDSIRKLQQADAGRIPTRSSAVVKENEVLTQGLLHDADLCPLLRYVEFLLLLVEIHTVSGAHSFAQQRASRGMTCNTYKHGWHTQFSEYLFPIQVRFVAKL